MEFDRTGLPLCSKTTRDHAIKWQNEDLQGSFLGPAIGDLDGAGKPELLLAELIYMRLVLEQPPLVMHWFLGTKSQKGRRWRRQQTKVAAASDAPCEG
jgi:hypothetical protein